MYNVIHYSKKLKEHGFNEADRDMAAVMMAASGGGS